MKNNGHVETIVKVGIQREFKGKEENAVNGSIKTFIYIYCIHYGSNNSIVKRTEYS